MLGYGMVGVYVPDMSGYGTVCVYDIGSLIDTTAYHCEDINRRTMA